MVTLSPTILTLPRWLLCWWWWHSFWIAVAPLSLYFRPLSVDIDCFPNVRTDELKNIVLFYQWRHYCKCRTYIIYKNPLSWYFWATVLWNEKHCIFYWVNRMQWLTLHFLFWHDRKITVDCVLTYKDNLDKKSKGMVISLVVDGGSRL